MADHFVRDMFRVFFALEEEGANDRVIAIVAAAYIEDHLTGLIKRKMPGLNADLATRIFRPGEGSLGSLARKLDMARALKVMEAKTCKEAVPICSPRPRRA